MKHNSLFGLMVGCAECREHFRRKLHWNWRSK